MVNVSNQQPEPELAEAPVLTILYQDQYLVAIDKPAGMLVHRSFLDRHETVFVMQTLRDQLGLEGITLQSKIERISEVFGPPSWR